MVSESDNSSSSLARTTLGVEWLICKSKPANVCWSGTVEVPDSMSCVAEHASIADFVNCLDWRTERAALACRGWEPRLGGIT